jgi:hypothetical protein
VGDKGVWIIIAVLAAGLAALAALRGTQSAPEPETPPAPPAVAPAPEAAEPPEPPAPAPISREMVDKLLYGMTYENVMERFGRESDETETEYDSGTPGYTSPSVTVWHRWDNPDGSAARVGFVNKKLERKVFVDAGGAPSGGTEPELWKDKEFKL